MKNKNIVITIIISICCNFCSNILAQSKSVIGLMPLSTNGYNKYEPNLYDVISAAFVESGRFTVVDRSVWNVIQKERELQKSEEFLNSKIAEQGKSLGAEFIIIGTINSISTAKQNLVNAQKEVTGYYYTAAISIGFKVLNVESGQIIANKNITGSTGYIYAGIGGASTPEIAINKVGEGIKKEIKKWIGEAFPAKTKVAKVLKEDDKNGAVLLLISGGSNAGIKLKNEMKIVYYENIVIDGKSIPRTVEIGKAIVTKVEDENFSECSVIGKSSNGIKSGLEVRDKLEEGKILYLITTE